MEKKALVVGSGFGGIASALRLRKLGFQVTILEKLDQIGGRARVLKNQVILLMPDQPSLPHHFYLMNYFPCLKKTEKNT